MSGKLEEVPVEAAAITARVKIDSDERSQMPAGRTLAISKRSTSNRTSEFKKVELFNPDKSWTPVVDEDQ